MWWWYSRIFILRHFIPSNLSGAQQLVQILSFKRGCWVIISQFVWMVIPQRRYQDSSWKWEGKTLIEIRWQSIHWPLFCDLVVITLCIITPWLLNITLEQALISRNSVSGISWRNLASLQVMMIMFSWASDTRDRHESLFLLPCYISTLNIWCLCVIVLLLTVWH